MVYFVMVISEYLLVPYYTGSSNANSYYIKTKLGSTTINPIRTGGGAV